MGKLRNNIIITILFQTLGKTSTAIATKKEDDLLSFLIKILNLANTELEKDQTIYSDLTPKEADNEIKKLDALYTVFNMLFNMLFKELSEETSIKIKNEYNRLIDNMEDLREGLELYMNEDVIQALDEIYRGNYQNYYDKEI